MDGLQHGCSATIGCEIKARTWENGERITLLDICRSWHGLLSGVCNMELSLEPVLLVVKLHQGS